MASPLVARVAGIREAAEHAVDGFIAIKPDGSPFSGGARFGICLMRDRQFLKRVAPVDAAVVPAKLIIQADPSIDPSAVARLLT